MNPRGACADSVPEFAGAPAGAGDGVLPVHLSGLQPDGLRGSHAPYAEGEGPEPGILEWVRGARSEAVAIGTLAHAFHGIISLHTDDSSQGFYGFASGATLTRNLIEPALQAAEQFLPRNGDEPIDGFRARNGIIRDTYPGVLSAPPKVRPRPFEISWKRRRRRRLSEGSRAGGGAADDSDAVSRVHRLRAEPVTLDTNKERKSSMPVYPDVISTVGRTPLIKLNRITNGAVATIAVKGEFFNPLGSVKDRIGYAMIAAAEREGLLTPRRRSSSRPRVTPASRWLLWPPPRATS